MIYKVDFSQPFFTQILVKQKDTSRVLDFQLLDNGKIMDLTGKSVIGYLRKPDGHQVMNMFDIVGGKSGIVSIQFTSQMLAVAGTGVLEIVVYDIDNKEISSMLINITIEESIRNGDEIQSTNEFTALSEAMAKMLAAEAILNDNGASLEARYTQTLADINNVLAGHATKIQEVHDLAERCSRDIGEISDLATLKSVLTLLNGTGGRIKIKPGTYSPTETMVVPRGVTVDGGGAVRFICDDENLNCIFVNKIDPNTVEYNGDGNIKIMGIEFDGNDTIHQISPIAFGHARNVEVNGCYFHNFNNWNNIQFNGCYNFRVVDSKFDNYGTTAGGNPTEVIQIGLMANNNLFPWGEGKYDNTSCMWGLIENNEFNNIYGKCIGNHTFIDGRMHDNITVRRNHVNIAWYFVNMSDTLNISMSDNWATVVGGFCHIDENDQFNFSRDIWIFNNTHVGTLKRPVFGNDLDDRFFRGYPTKDSTTAVHIYNNQIRDVASHAIAFTGHDAQIHDNFIEGAGRHGIYVYGGNNCNVHDNFVNDISQRSIGTWKHIYIGGNNQAGGLPTFRCSVHDNIANDIELGAECRSCKISNNTAARVANNSGDVSTNKIYDNYNL